MAMVAIRVPAEAARLLSAVAGALPGDSQAASEMHVTLLYLGDDVPMEQLARVMVACYAVTRKTAPFTMTVSEVASFDPGGNGTPVILPVQSPELHELQGNLRQELDRSGVDYDKKWPEYKPHVTLSYVPNMKAAGPMASPISWGAFDLTIYGANRGDGRATIILPFAPQSFQVQMEKIASKIATAFSNRDPKQCV